MWHNYSMDDMLSMEDLGLTGGITQLSVVDTTPPNDDADINAMTGAPDVQMAKGPIMQKAMDMRLG